MTWQWRGGPSGRGIELMPVHGGEFPLLVGSLLIGVACAAGPPSERGDSMSEACPRASMSDGPLDGLYRICFDIMGP